MNSVFHTGRTGVSLSVLMMALIAGLALTSTSMLPISMAASSNDTNVSLDINEETSVTIAPNEYNFSGMDLGETNFSDMFQLRLTIENDGSTNISNIYAHVNTLEAEPTNPLGASSADKYAASGFLFVKNDTSGMYHAGRLSWNITESAGGKPSGITDSNNAQAYGYYRNASAGNYLWSLAGNGTSTTNSVCNSTTNSAPELKMKNNVDTGDNRDLSDTGSTTTYTLDTTSSEWAGTKATAGPLDGHYIAAWWECNKFLIYRFDATSSLPGSGADGQYLLGPDTVEELAPGGTYEGRVGAAVPEGVPGGVTNQSTLTVFASSSN